MKEEEMSGFLFFLFVALRLEVYINGMEKHLSEITVKSYEEKRISQSLKTPLKHLPKEKKHTHLNHNLPPPLLSLTTSHTLLPIILPLSASTNIRLPSFVPSYSTIHSPNQPSPTSPSSGRRVRTTRAVQA